MVRQIRAGDRRLKLTDGAKAYADLRDKVTQAGLLKRQYGYYSLFIFFTLLGFFGSAFALYYVQNLWAVFAWSLIFGFFSIQIGGSLHDAGHMAIAKSVFWNDVWGQVFGNLICLGYSNWKRKHNTHHAHTNEVDGDPDIDLPLINFTKERIRKQKGIMRWLSRHQVYFYYLLGSLAAFSQRIDNYVFIKDNYHKPTKWWEIGLFAVSVFAWFFLPFLIFPLTKALIIFITVHIGNGFYILHIFAPNHKGMPEVTKEAKLSFLEQQVMTSRNVNSHWLTDYIYLGLNYQIEHHLFPNCPRPNLRKLSPYVKEVCAKMGLEYTSVSVIQTDLIILKELYLVGRSA